MIKLYPCIIALLLLCSRSFAQNNSITIDHNYLTSSVCVNATFKLPVVLSGTFNADNKYTVQIRKLYANNISAEIPAVLVGGNLEFKISDSLTFGNSYIQMRAITSSPKAQSDWSSSIGVHTKGSVVLNPPGKSDTLNAYDRVEILLRGTNFQEGRVTLSDSSKISIYSNDGIFAQPYSLTIAASGTYRIAHAENFCGAMAISGSYTAVVNKTSVKTMLVTPSALCENSEVTVRISTNGEAFTNATKYKVRFLRYASSGEMPAILEAPATVDGNFLKTRFPSNANINGNASYNVQVVTENPATVSSIYQSPIQVWAAPNATFNTQSQTINFGEFMQLAVNMTGLPPYSVEFTDGTIYNSNSSTAYFTSYPIADQNFSIKSITTGCGKTEIRDPQVVEIKLRQGIRIDDSQRQLICAGTQGKIKVLTNVNFTGSSQFFVKLHNQFNGETSTLPASKNGDYIEFALPPRESGYGGYGYQIITTQPALQTNVSYNVVLQTMPNVQYAGFNETYVYEKPQIIALRYGLTGGSPYKIEYMDGTIAEYEYEGNIAGKDFFLKSDTEFKIKSISNSCFSNNNPRSVNLSVKSTSAPGIYLEPIRKEICEDDSIEIVFGTVGSFNAGNKFYIQGYGNCCEFQTLKTIESGGTYKVKIKSNYSYSNNGGVRIASTNPVLFSEVQSTTLQQPLSNITIYPETTAENPTVFLATGGGYVTVRSQTSSISQATYSIDGGADQVYTSTNTGSSSIEVPIKSPVGKMAVYKIKSVANTCGSVPVNLNAHLIPAAYRIQLTSYYNNSYFCPGDPISVSFGVGEGKASSGATFDLEFTKQNTTDKTIIVKGGTGPALNGFIPANLAAGYYSVRVVSSDGPATDSYSVQVSEPATVNLVTENMSDNITVEAGQTVILKLVFTGSNPWTTIWQDNSTANYYSGNQENVYVYPQKSQQYAIKMISNACGYGTVSGSVKVSVKPRLTMQSNTSSVCPGNAVRITYSLAGEADLSDAYIRFVLTDLDKNTEIPLDSTKTIAGDIDLKIPAILTGSRYQIRGTVAKYDLTSEVNVYVTTRTDLSISGNTIINSGTATQLALRSTKSTGYLEYTLSDGTRGNFYAFPGQINYVRVQPRQTTTYTISSVRNECGAGDSFGSATVEVNPVSAKSVSVTSWTSQSSAGFCTGDTIAVSYATLGTFTSGNIMTVQISDTTGKNFRSITTIGNTNPLKAVLPVDLIPNGQYRMRVAASDPGTASGAYELAMVAGQKAKARFASESVIFDGKTNPKITVLLEGGAPWTYQWGTDLLINTRQTHNPTDVIELFQASPNQFYRLFKVSNYCGFGTIESPGTVRVEMVTASEPALTFKVTVAPNPAQEVLNVTFENAAALKKIILYDLNGRVLRQSESRKAAEELNIAALQSGIYVLMVESKGRKSTFKIVKQ
ncbi:T9SS type A sorting domain-containing protein [Dyadobacter sp. CY343]|uniref:T9SS type A sorting domain-containing protein n=1 Tax=Dyadobacter sp. CY343 TaxID=2907299 RepID=UPI001F44DB8B|nr:T9SS type A sorting domain-containing protein [Dyadobacter sp. CY343]MCE7060940.1 T9SS type A sorting domain-containing protein [Dyadobacter sp. CY343]